VATGEVQPFKVSSFNDHEDVTHMQLVLQFCGIIQPLFYCIVASIRIEFCQFKYLGVPGDLRRM
jgi:hypothetical protein